MKGEMVVMRLLVLLALLIGSCIDVAAQSEIQNLLNEGRNLFYGARFGEAVRVLSAAEKLVDSSTSVADAAWVKVYLGASYYALSENDSAKKTFAEICKIDRDFNITEKEFSPSIVDLFRLGKQQCVAEACETNCSAIRSAARNRDPDQIKKAVDAAGRCSCDDARQMAAQVVVENAIDNYKKQQYALAQTQFQLAVNLSPQPATGSTRPGAGSVDAQPKLQTATIEPRVLLDLETGNQIGAGADLMWIEINQIRHLIPQRRARVALLSPSSVFELITLDQLRRVSYTEGAIGAKDQPLRAGMIIAVQTTDGSFAKLRIDSVGTSLAIRWIVYL
jgi:tetratricopeptide (TPR) repeat protein